MGSKSFSSLLKELENCKDITPVIRAQKSTLLRYEETNEMLRQFIVLSNSTQTMLLENYTSHARTLVDLRNNLESSFRRIRALKGKLKESYPDAFEATSAAIKELEEKHLHDDEERFDQQSDDMHCEGDETSLLESNVSTDNVDNNSSSETLGDSITPQETSPRHIEFNCDISLHEEVELQPNTLLELATNKLQEVNVSDDKNDKTDIDSQCIDYHDDNLMQDNNSFYTVDNQTSNINENNTNNV